VDALTPAICQIQVAPRVWSTLTEADGIDYIYVNSPTSWLYQRDISPIVFNLDHRILEIDEVKWTNKQWILTKVSVSKWQHNPYWEQVIGMPTEYATDYSNNVLVVNFRAEDTDTLRLQVLRMPLTDIKNDNDIPDMRNHYHDFMKNGVLALMYSKQDAETIDKAKATEYDKMYLRDLDEIKQQESIINRRLQPNNSLSAFR
jgi:hypothetical protein